MEPLRIRDHVFESRLFVGSGKYADYDTMLKAWEASGTKCVTVALRRVDLGLLPVERDLHFFSHL